jgi:hypothetical protein
MLKNALVFEAVKTTDEFYSKYVKEIEDYILKCS